jgi:hypothetical protein
MPGIVEAYDVEVFLRQCRARLVSVSEQIGVGGRAGGTTALSRSSLIHT